MADPTYMHGILSEPLDLDGGTRRGPRTPRLEATAGLEVTHRATGVIGAVVECTPAAVVLRDDSGRDRRVRNIEGGFLHEGNPVTLVTARTDPSTATRITASGSIATSGAPARIARASRILVEGVHDAELVEKVWGDDLRDEGIVVQPMDGADDLVDIVGAFRPAPGRRLGILLDHLVDRSKESRLASQIDHPQVLIRGHRFIDIWAAIDPRLAGLDAWPEVPRDVPWKTGICRAVGVDESWQFWKQLLGKVTSFRDLDPSLVGAVEELIDFVCDPAS